MNEVRGLLALVAGDGAALPADVHRPWLDTGRPGPVVVVPTAAAYEHADREVERVAARYADAGATVRGLDLLHRRDAVLPELVEEVAAASVVHVCDGSALHLRSVLKDSPVIDAVRRAWTDGATVVGTGAGAVALCDPMVDPRGGGLTVGLGLVVGLAVLDGCDADDATGVEHRRTLELATPSVCVAAIPHGAALVRDPHAGWRAEGTGEVAVFREEQRVGLEALPG